MWGRSRWIYLAAPHSGILSQFLSSTFGLPPDLIPIYGIGGAIWVLSLFYTPYVYLFVIAPMRQMDPALEDAARVHGAGFWTTLRHITLPLLYPALISGALVVFVTSAGLFDVPLALAAPKGIRTMPTEIFQLVQYPSDFGRAASFGVIVMAVTVLLTVMQRRYLGQRRFETVTGKGYRPRIIALRRRGRIAAFALEAIYIGAGVVLPVMALLMVSFSSIWTGKLDPARLTTANYDYVLFSYSLTRQAILNSLFLALVGASAGIVISVLQAYYVNRGNRKRRALVDAVLSLPLGIPGIILGLGFLILAIRTPLYSTLAIILIAYVARFFPFATRTISAMLLAINPELEQSARASGATWLQTMRYVLLPLLLPAIIAGWLMLFVIFIRELGATILLYAQGTETISVALVVLSRAQHRTGRGARGDPAHFAAVRLHAVSRDARVAAGLRSAPRGLPVDQKSAQALRRPDRRRRGLARGRGGPHARVARPVGLRQDHDPALPRRARDGGRRRDRDRRQAGVRPCGRHQPDAGRARARHRVSVLCGVAAYDRRRKRGVSPHGARRAQAARQRSARRASSSSWG